MLLSDLLYLAIAVTAVSGLLWLCGLIELNGPAPTSTLVAATYRTITQPK